MKTKFTKNNIILFLCLVVVSLLFIPKQIVNERFNNKKLTFCICFFGVIPRSIKFTIESIKKNIFDVLTDSNISFDTYVHNMKVDTFLSKRAGDHNVTVDNNLCKLLPATEFSEINQIDFDNNYDWKKISKYGYTEGDINTLQNAIRQLYSVKQVTKLWDNKKNTNYDYYIYLRPDLLYINKIDIHTILQNINKKNVLLTPHWHKSGGINDRIYMGNKNVIKIFGNRFDEAYNMTEKYKSVYHAEKHMKYIAEKYNIKTVDINLKGKRVRTNGIPKEENFTL